MSRPSSSWELQSRDILSHRWAWKQREVIMSEHEELSIAIVGGGIGGLTAALSLLQAGVDVHVYERATTISELGAGIAVSPNATRILYRLGLSGALEAMGIKTFAWHFRRWDGGWTLLPPSPHAAGVAAFRLSP